MNRIEDGRAEIDRLDAELVRLLNRRVRLALEIGRLKKAAGLPVLVPGREHLIVRRAVEANEGPLDRLGVEKILQAIIRESRRLEESVLQREAAAAESKRSQGSGVKEGEAYP